MPSRMLENTTKFTLRCYCGFRENWADPSYWIIESKIKQLFRYFFFFHKMIHIFTDSGQDASCAVITTPIHVSNISTAFIESHYVCVFTQEFKRRMLCLQFLQISCRFYLKKKKKGTSLSLSSEIKIL